MRRSISSSNKRDFIAFSRRIFSYQDWLIKSIRVKFIVGSIETDELSLLITWMLQCIEEGGNKLSTWSFLMHENVVMKLGSFLTEFDKWDKKMSNHRLSVGVQWFRHDYHCGSMLLIEQKAIVVIIEKRRETKSVKTKWRLADVDFMQITPSCQQ